MWIKWLELEPTEGQYRFHLLQERIEEAKELQCCVVLRILTSATIFAPEWISKYSIPIREEKSKNKPKVTNYDISQPEFHKRYLLLVDKVPRVRPCFRFW
jgi:hypothetical protein